MMLSHEAIRLLDDVNVGEQVIVVYAMEGVTLVADGTYCGCRKLKAYGSVQWCLLIGGDLGAEQAIPMIDVSDLQRAG